MFRSGDWLHNDVIYPHEKKGDSGVRKMILILNYCVCPDNPPELNLATPKPAHMRTLGIASSRWLGIKEWRFSLVIMPHLPEKTVSFWRKPIPLPSGTFYC